MKYLKTYITCILLAFALFATTQAFAQGPPPPPQSENTNEEGSAPVPIDGGLSLLIAAGAALGGKKIYDARKKKA